MRSGKCLQFLVNPALFFLLFLQFSLDGGNFFHQAVLSFMKMLVIATGGTNLLLQDTDLPLQLFLHHAGTRHIVPCFLDLAFQNFQSGIHFIVIRARLLVSALRFRKVVLCRVQFLSGLHQVLSLFGRIQKKKVDIQRLQPIPVF